MMMTPAKTIHVGAVIDRTGQNSDPNFDQSIQLAELHANEGLKMASNNALVFKINFHDTISELTKAVDGAKALVADPGVKTIVTDASGTDVELNKLQYDADMANDLNVPIFCAGCPSNAINNPTAADADMVAQLAKRNGQGWNFRSIMTAKNVALVVMRHLGALGDQNGDGKLKISVYDRNEPGVKLTKADLQAFATTLGITATFESILHPRDLDPNSYNWAADVDLLTDDKDQATMMVDGLPDFIVVSTFAQFEAAFIRAYKTAGKTTRVFHFQSFRISSTLTSLGVIANGEEGVSHALLNDSQSGSDFSSAYMTKYGSPVVYRAANFYDATYMTLLAVMLASKDKEDPTTVTGAEVKEALKKLSDPMGEVVRPGAAEFAKAIGFIKEGKAINYDGASGPMDLDAQQNVTGNLARYKVESGVFVDVEKFGCVSADTCPKL